MKNIFFFSGLGADERVFQYLDLSFCNPVFIKWNLPVKNESIENYALRLTEQIKDKNPILIGVSFGGMIAVEVSKLIKTEKVIIISSAKTKREIPMYYKFAGKIHVHKIIPTSLFQKFKSINQFLFGINTQPEKELLNNIISETNPDFLIWAIDKIVNWQNETIAENLIHIHGTKDKILPYKYVNPGYTIQNGEHLMIIKQVAEINKLIKKLHN